LLIGWGKGNNKQEWKRRRGHTGPQLLHLQSTKRQWRTTDLDSRLVYPIPRPRSRLSSFKTKTNKNLMPKTKTETQD